MEARIHLRACTCQSIQGRATRCNVSGLDCVYDVRFPSYAKVRLQRAISRSKARMLWAASSGRDCRGLGALLYETITVVAAAKVDASAPWVLHEIRSLGRTTGTGVSVNLRVALNAVGSQHGDLSTYSP
ncbi:hypothetical protein C8Q79DRAFT_955792 [Trametes meyenii]|nr:hypothetical protein C8Q79DRAFT_955792 [Trametes meyenii]